MHLMWLLHLRKEEDIAQEVNVTLCMSSAQSPVLGCVSVNRFMAHIHLRQSAAERIERSLLMQSAYIQTDPSLAAAPRGVNKSISGF